MSKFFVIRSLPFFADSRIERNCNLFSKNSISCTWEKEKNSKLNINNINFPFNKGGSRIVKLLKYVFFILWVPYLILTKANKKDTIVFMDLETIILGGFAAKFKKATVVFDIVDPFSQTKSVSSFFSFLIDRIEFSWAEFSDIVIVPNSSRIKYYKDRVNKVLVGDNILIIENVPKYKSSSTFDNKFNIDLDSSKINIGYFGTLDTQTVH